MVRILDDPKWYPHVGQFLVVVNDIGQIHRRIPFVKVTYYKTGQKSFNVQPVALYVKKVHTEQVSDKPINYFIESRPAESSNSEPNEKYYERLNDEEYTCRFSRAQKHKKWIIDINGYIQYLEEYDPSVYY